MANFDKNSWYQVTVASHPGQDLDGTPVYDEGRGAVFFQITNTSLSQHQWQVFLYNTSNYVFRTKASGAGSFLSAAFAATEETPGKTIPQMRVSAIADSSMFWQIGPWGDGTFYMTNLANGSAWHLLNKPNSLMAMSSNITAPQNGQRFSFTSIGKINSSPFSDVVTPSATATKTGTSSTSSSTLPTSPMLTSATTAEPSSGGISSTTIAAIAASIGGVFLIIICIVAFVCYRRRKGRNIALVNAQSLAPQQQQQQQQQEQQEQEHSYYDPVKEHNSQTQPAEIPSVELPANHQPVELPAESFPPHHQAGR